MNRLTRLVVLLRAFAAALAACFCAADAVLAAVVVVGCIYCRLTTDAVFGARLPRLQLWRVLLIYLLSSACMQLSLAASAVVENYSSETI